MSEGEPPTERMRVDAVARVDQDSRPVAFPVKGNTSDGPIGQLAVDNRDTLFLDYAFDVYGLALYRFGIDVIVKALGQFISLEPRGRGSFLQWDITTSLVNCRLAPLRCMEIDHQSRQLHDISFPDAWRDRTEHQGYVARPCNDQRRLHGFQNRTAGTVSVSCETTRHPPPSGTNGSFVRTQPREPHQTPFAMLLHTLHGQNLSVQFPEPTGFGTQRLQVFTGAHENVMQRPGDLLWLQSAVSAFGFREIEMGRHAFGARLPPRNLDTIANPPQHNIGKQPAFTCSANRVPLPPLLPSTLPAGRQLSVVRDRPWRKTGGPQRRPCGIAFVPWKSFLVKQRIPVLGKPLHQREKVPVDRFRSLTVLLVGAQVPTFDP